MLVFLVPVPHILPNESSQPVAKADIGMIKIILFTYLQILMALITLIPNKLSNNWIIIPTQYHFNYCDGSSFT